jgi:mannose-6-phosphate isomerase-like protein (cupin superfamily)
MHQLGIENRDDVMLLIRRFASAEYFRSATVDELELNGDFCRRPLRPEDLEFINFAAPVAAGTICDLPSLAAQRILRCIYDLHIARLPRKDDPQMRMRRADFYSDNNRIIAAKITPFLERFAFGFLQQRLPTECELSQTLLRERFARFVCDANSYARLMKTRFSKNEFSKEVFRFMLIQKWCLDSIREIAIARAQASGFFDVLSAEDWPHYNSRDHASDVLAKVAMATGVNRDPNTFWQFYLPTSLAETNYLCALAARPELALTLVGASFIAEAECQSFTWMAQHVSRDLGIVAVNGHSPEDLDGVATDTSRRFARALSAIETAYGECGLQEISKGVEEAVQITRLAHIDLEKQLRWLATLNDYAQIGQHLDRQIQSQGANIDRETFVEPREMCSTTHVHNDHRLVIVESGQMVFWGRPEMRFRMAPGDMILVPRGRLHGSSVESEQCTYHQPILPEEWVRPLINKADERHGWPLLASLCE